VADSRSHSASTVARTSRNEDTAELQSETASVISALTEASGLESQETASFRPISSIPTPSRIEHERRLLSQLLEHSASRTESLTVSWRETAVERIIPLKPFITCWLPPFVKKVMSSGNEFTIYGLRNIHDTIKISGLNNQEPASFQQAPVRVTPACIEDGIHLGMLFNPSTSSTESSTVSQRGYTLNLRSPIIGSPALFISNFRTKGSTVLHTKYFIRVTTADSYLITVSSYNTKSPTASQIDCTMTFYPHLITVSDYNIKSPTELGTKYAIFFSKEKRPFITVTVQIPSKDIVYETTNVVVGGSSNRRLTLNYESISQLEQNFQKSPERWIPPRN
jgi:hypothetical protein